MDSTAPIVRVLAAVALVVACASFGIGVVLAARGLTETADTLCGIAGWSASGALLLAILHYLQRIAFALDNGDTAAVVAAADDDSADIYAGKVAFGGQPPTTLAATPGGSPRPRSPLGP